MPPATWALLLTVSIVWLRLPARSCVMSQSLNHLKGVFFEHDSEFTSFLFPSSSLLSSLLHFTWLYYERKLILCFFFCQGQNLIGKYCYFQVIQISQGTLLVHVLELCLHEGNIQWYKQGLLVIIQDSQNHRTVCLSELDCIFVLKKGTNSSTEWTDLFALLAWR